MALELIDLSVPIQLPVEGEMTDGLSVTLAADIQYNDHDPWRSEPPSSSAARSMTCPTGKAGRARSEALDARRNPY